MNLTARREFALLEFLMRNPNQVIEEESTFGERIADAVARFGGSISAEHGLGQLKRDEIQRYKSPLELELMRKLKRALDPQGIMNPGKVL